MNPHAKFGFATATAFLVCLSWACHDSKTAAASVAPSSTTRFVQAAQRPEFASDEVLVRWRSSPHPKTARVKALERALKLNKISVIKNIHVDRYKVPTGTDVIAMVKALEADPEVQFAEPNYYRYSDDIPNDPSYDNQSMVATDLQKWVYDGLPAPPMGQRDKNLNAEAAWSLTTGRSDVVIAIIDSGVAINHPDLAANIWTNPGEIAGNGIDDDGNMFQDDVNGWDFWGNDNDPNPDLGDGLDNDGSRGPDSTVFHGTFAASCAGAVTDNATGIAGAAWNCRLMALKVGTDDGGFLLSDIATAIGYAADNGADVISMSFGSINYSLVEANAVDDAWMKGVVQVASAGNGNSSATSFPATLGHVISVGASDNGQGGSGDIDGRASFSQYGNAAVDVVAPGSLIAGAYVNSVADGMPGTFGYSISSGTSFSTPIVAGLAALIISRSLDLNVQLTNDDVEELIQIAANDMPDDPGDFPDAGAGWDENGRVDFCISVAAIQNGVYVDCAHTGIESGTFERPYSTLQEGIQNVTSGENVVIKEGTCTIVAPITIGGPPQNKAMTLRGAGTVTIQ